MLAFVGCSAIETMASLSFWQPVPVMQSKRAKAQANNCNWKARSLVMMDSFSEKDRRET
jgi:hypothetical protein